MDNEIKPAGGFNPFADPAAGDTAEPERKTSFAGMKDTAAVNESAKTPSRSLGVVAQYRKSELQDPAKLDSIVRASVRELIDSSESLTGPLSGAEKQFLLDFLSEDPMIRQQVENYLRKVLS